MRTRNIARLRSRTNSTSFFTQRLEEALDVGFCQPFHVSELAPRNNDLLSAYEDFYRDNPALEEELRSVDDVIDTNIDVKDALKKAIEESSRLAGARLLNIYNRYYRIGDEGTDWHDDINTGADLVVTKTNFGRAEFGCRPIDNQREPLSVTLGPDIMVVFRADCEHVAGSPLDNTPRSIEGYAITVPGA